MLKIPKKVEYIINKLQVAGFEAYIVGGCVRDSIIGLNPHDWDITTSAVPDQIIEVFKGQRIIETGLKHGTVTVVLNGEAFEVTTFRTDGVYSDGRRPDSVEFTTSLVEDLKRRDFTMNAIAYNSIKGYVDPFGGKLAIERKIICCVGNANDRFKEDSLRILRGLRFASVFGFEIDVDTARAMHSNKSLLHNVAMERVSVEFDKMLLGENVVYVLDSHKEIWAELFPEILPMAGFKQNNLNHCFDVWVHTLVAVAAAPKSVKLRRVMFLHDIGKPSCYSEDERGGHFYGHPEVSYGIAKKFCDRMKYSNEDRDEILELVLYHDYELATTKKAVRKLLNKLGVERTKLLLDVRQADIAAQSDFFREKKLEQVKKVQDLIVEIVEDGECFALKDLAINGGHLIELGLKPGKQFGEILNLLLNKVIEGELINDEIVLLLYVKAQY